MKQALLLVLIALLAPAFAHGATPTTLTLSHLHKPYVVPAGQVWKVTHLVPYESENGVGTADLYVEGSAQVGESRASNLYGKFDFTVSAAQVTPLWLDSGTRVGVGDSRGTVVVQVYKDP